MRLTIPTVGLEEVRLVWAGRGGLWSAVAAADDQRGYKWSPVLARRRAMRVAVEVLRPQLQAWPSSVGRWVDALPAQSVRYRHIDDQPGSGVDWPATRRSGWPPREFHHRQRSRVPDTLLVTATRWTIEELVRAVRDVDSFDSAILGSDARSRLRTAAAMLGLEPLASSHPVVPTPPDLVALRTSGRPWGAVAAVASCLRTIDHDPAQLALLPLDPDPALADRLFHVAVLGCIMRGLTDAGWRVIPTGLLGSPDGKPQFSAIDTDGRDWDVWFEMAGAWSHYGVASPYGAAVAGITGTGGPLGADIAFVRRPDSAIIIECKYSADPTYVGRNGYEQALAYMSEARSGLVGSVGGIVVGAREVVNSTGRTETAVGPVTVTHPGEVATEIGLMANEVTSRVFV